MFDPEKFGEAVGLAIQEAMAPLRKRIVDLEARPIAPVVDIAAEVDRAVTAAVDSLPAPVNGKDADPAEIARMVGEAVAALPTPKDGSSVTVDDVGPLIAQQVAAAVSALPPAPAGKDAEPVDKAAVINEILAALPAPKDGQSVTVEDVSPLITEQVKAAVDAIPRPAAGKDAEPLDHGAVVKDVLAAIRQPEDGKSVTPTDVEPMLAEMLAKAVDALPKPKDGESVPVDQVQRMIDDAVSKAMAAVRMPKDGEPGRDAAHIEILPAIDAEKSYPRGSYAKHAGGLWRSYETTDDMRGWECIVDGVASMAVESIGVRGFEVVVSRSSGETARKSVELPAMIYRGVFHEGDDYSPGDTVTWGGSLFHCNEPTREKPIDGSKTWQLAAKRGRDGKDGTNGKDLTKGVPIK